MSIGIGNYHLRVTKKSFRTGYFLIIISAILTALTHVLAKPLVDNQTGFEFNPIVLAACIYMINGAFFTPFTKKCQPIKSVGIKNFIVLAIIGVSEAIAIITYFLGLKGSTAANASVLSNGEIIFSLLITIIVFREILPQREVIPFALIIFGMIGLPLMHDIYAYKFSEFVLSDFMLLGSGIFYAVNVSLCRYVSNSIDIKRFMQVISLVSGACAFLALFIFNIPFEVNIWSLGPIAIYAIGGTGISAMLFVISLRIIGGARTILLFSTNAAFGVIFAGMLLGESITFVNISSVVFALIGVYLLRNRLGSSL